YSGSAFRRGNRRAPRRRRASPSPTDVRTFYDLPEKGKRLPLNSSPVVQPDFFHVRERPKEMGALPVAGSDPVGSAPGGPRPPHIRRRGKRHHLHAVAGAEVPHGLYVVMLG